jgi:hypothetical protein
MSLDLRRLQRWVIGASVALALHCAPARAAADTVYGVTQGTNQLVVYDTVVGALQSVTSITGLQVGETVVGIDIRPASGVLYAVGSTGRLYTLDSTTAVATPVHSTAAPFAALVGTSFGVDFNPVTDVLRVVSNSQRNLRVNPDTGALAGLDTNLNPGGSVVALASTNNFAATNLTTVYGIDSGTDSLVLVGGLGGGPSPNGGSLTNVGPLGFDVSDALGFDIVSLGVDLNVAYASLTIAGSPGLYTIDLNTGAATFVDALGATPLTSLAVKPLMTVTMYGVTSSNVLVRFRSARPATLLGFVAISGLQTGEEILGIDFRPATGQLYALGSTARLYTIDVASGQALQIGSPLPVSLNGTSFGLDFDPAADRLRIVSDAGQNLRVHPDTGALVATDTPLNPASSVVAAAYSNNVAGSATTTLYGIDGGSAELVRIGGLDGSPSPNDGAVTPIGLLGLDVDAPIGFDIAYDGTGYFTFNVNGSAFITPVDLTTGAAKLIGSIGGGAALRAVAAAVPGGVRFTKSTYFATEGGGFASVSLSRTGDTTNPLSVTFATTNGTATPADYTDVTKTVTFLPGQQTVTVSVPLAFVFDADEPDETVMLTLSNPLFGATQNAPATATLRILDTDAPDAAPTIQITSPTANPTFEANTALITLTGTAADDGGIASVSWQTEAGVSGTATGTTAWTASNIPLSPGVNRITVWAIDTFGNSSTALLTVTVKSLLYTLAEGATGGFFDTDVLLANPNTVSANVTLQFLKEDGTALTQLRSLPPMSRTTVVVDTISGLEEAATSTTVTSTSGLPIVVERTMRWDATGYGAHTEKATAGPASTWYFAEGSQGFFDTFLLLSNPNPSANTASVDFLLESGATVNVSYPLEPTQRRTIHLASVPDLVNQSFGIVVHFTNPGVAERAMYFGTPTFNGGHASAGETAPATSWFLAEGATGDYFTTFVLLANPSPSDAEVTLTYLPLSGTPLTKMTTVPAGQRRTINLQLEDSSLLNTSVATRVDSTQPIVVERAQYWPGPAQNWFEAHNSFGVTALGTKWGLAEGRVGGTAEAQTYILLANPGADPADVTLTFLRAPGSNPQTVTKVVTVPATSRFNVTVGAGTLVPELTNEPFGALISSTQPIAVERALYTNANGVVWAAGTNATATRLP